MNVVGGWVCARAAAPLWRCGSLGQYACSVAAGVRGRGAGCCPSGCIPPLPPPPSALSGWARRIRQVVARVPCLGANRFRPKGFFGAFRASKKSHQRPPPERGGGGSLTPPPPRHRPPPPPCPKKNPRQGSPAVELASVNGSFG